MSETTARTLADPCGVGRLLAMLGGRWKGPLIWWLRTGPRGFNDLRRHLPGVSARVLANQLRQLEADGVIVRDALDDKRGRVCYALTPLGQQLLPLLDTMQAWCGRHLPTG